MLIRLKTYKDSCGFFANGKKLEKYDPDNPDLCFIYEDSNKQITVPAEYIKLDTSGMITFNNRDVKYIIDDGYRDTLVKVGYILADNYDESCLDDIILAEELQDRIKRQYSRALEYIEKFYDDGQIILDEYGAPKTKTDVYKIRRTDHTFSITLRGWKENIVACPISKVIEVNVDRKNSNQPFYPYDKDVNKYGALFLVVYAEKQKEGADCYARHMIPEGIIKNILKSMNDNTDGISYKFNSIDTRKKRVINNGINVIV
jgi:hypothetical protein